MSLWKKSLFDLYCLETGLSKNNSDQTLLPTLGNTGLDGPVSGYPYSLRLLLHLHHRRVDFWVVGNGARSASFAIFAILLRLSLAG